MWCSISNSAFQTCSSPATSFTGEHVKYEHAILEFEEASNSPSPMPFLGGQTIIGSDTASRGKFITF